MWPVSPSFIAALTGSPTVVMDATATLPGGSTAPVLIAGGSVRVDTGSLVRRQLDCTVVDPAGRTSNLLAVLKTEGGELAVRRGIAYPNGREEWAPLGVFRIDSLDDDVEAGGVVKVKAPDRMARIVDDRFLAPVSSSAGLLVSEQIRRLLQQTIPGVQLLDYSGSTARVRGGVVWERERAEAVTDLARSIGCELYADPLGRFVLQPARSLADPSDWLVSAGPRGVLVSGQRSRTRERVANSVSAQSSATDGTTPVFAVVEDTDPTSPTYVLGPFGRVPRFYASPLLTTTAQCEAAARSILVRYLGARSSLSIGTVVNPALEGGDRIDAYLPDGDLQRHIVDGFTVPLDVATAMTISTRVAQDISDVQ